MVKTPKYNFCKCILTLMQCSKELHVREGPAWYVLLFGLTLSELESEDNFEKQTLNFIGSVVLT